MRFKTIALALFACLALGAFATNAAQAAEGEGWTIGATENQNTAGTLIPSGTHERISCKKHGTSSLTFTSKLLGANVELSAEGVECLEKAGSTNASTIDNTTSKGHSEVVLTFQGVVVIKPAHCAVGGATHHFTTTLLTDEIFMDPGGGLVVFDRFISHDNHIGTFEFEGALCPLAEDRAAMKGSFCGEAVHTNAAGTGFGANKTGTLTKVQTLLFGSTQQTTGNSTAKPCALTFGTEAAQLAGAVDNELSGTNAGKPFGSD